MKNIQAILFVSNDVLRQSDLVRVPFYGAHYDLIRSIPDKACKPD